MSERSPHASLIIGVAGGTGSGKSTFAHELVKRLMTNQLVHIMHDAYYRDLSHLPLEERRQVNFDHPDSLETDLLIRDLERLKAGQAIDVPVYNYVEHTRTSETIHIEPQPVVLVEGILIFCSKELRELMDIRIFVDTDADIRFMRRLKRDIEERGRTLDSVFNQYIQTVRPMHDAFVEPSKRYADIIVPSGGYNRPALDMVTARIKSHF